MSQRRILVVGMGVIAVLAMGGNALGAYDKIQDNLINLKPDTSYYLHDRLEIAEAGVNNLTLTDGGAILPGAISESSASLVTYWHHFDPAPVGEYQMGRAIFTGGSYTLDFKYNGSPCHMEGDIDGMVVGVNTNDVNFRTISGGAKWTVDQGSLVLPGSGIWDDGGGFSSIHSFTLYLSGLPGLLQNFYWDTTKTGGETQYILLPNDSAVPEPATLMLLALGGVLGLRRRRA